MCDIPKPEFIRGGQKKLYSFHPFTKELNGETVTEPDPRDENRWVYPAFSTVVVPPEIAQKQAATFDIDMNIWLIVPDHRGETWYQETGESVDIKTLGDPSEQGLLKEQPPEPEKPIVYPDLTARQIRLGLRQLGLLNQVQPLINQLPSGQKEDAQIEWDYATDFKRDHWLIGQIAQALNIDEKTFNEKWLEYSTL